MTPQLQQAIKLLQLSRMELVEAIQQEIEENPLLEEISAAGEDAESDLSPDIDEIRASERTSGEVTGEGDGKDEFDWNTYLEDYGPVGVTYYREDAEGPTWENVLTKKPSLTDHLMWQLRLSHMT
jgi:RNA polymerase sigma-54 factor